MTLGESYSLLSAGHWQYTGSTTALLNSVNLPVVLTSECVHHQQHIIPDIAKHLFPFPQCCFSYLFSVSL